MGMIKKYVSDLKGEFHGYNVKKLSQDAMAGLTVAAVALPLALAFSVSSGADAASGLITAIFAGIITGLLSGASYQISGPTGAMAAILLTLSAKFGIPGVMLAGFMSGAVLLLLSLFKVGKLVSYIPSPVITGFTSGIAIIIALGQVDNLFGTVSKGDSVIMKLISYGELGFTPQLMSLMFGGLVMLIMIVFPKKLGAIVPSSLVGIIVALVINMIINPDAATSGVTEVGAIPQSLLTGTALLTAGFDFSHINELIMPALSIAALGMVESLLCGASAGNMKNEKLDADRELFAQGLGNMIIPLFGGIPATAAIARTSVAIKSGGQTRLVSVFHSVVLLLSMFLLGSVMSRIPLSALAGVLIVTAFRMNDWKEIKHIFKHRFKSEISMYILTMAATVVFDLTVAIVIGIVLAMLLFIVKSSELTVTVNDVDDKRLSGKGLKGDHSQIKLMYLTGPLFFGTQEKLTAAIEQTELEGADTVIMSMRAVPLLDSNAMHRLDGIYNHFKESGVKLCFCGLNPNVKAMFDRSGFTEKIGDEDIFWDAVAAIKSIDMENSAVEAVVG